MTAPWLDDGDVRLYRGDAASVLRSLPADSVQTCVTSPPYWGLRSYLDDGHDDKASELGLEATPDLYVERMVAVFREVWRVLRDDGTCWINLGDSYTSGDFTRQGKPRNVPQLPNDWAGTELGGRGRAAHANAIKRDLGHLKAKDLVGIPWRVAFALQADGWYLRSDIIWAKPNPMPESVTDRPTKAHEYVFLLSKRPRYFYDADAVREDANEPTRRAATFRNGGVYTAGRSFENSASAEKDSHGDGAAGAGRNLRSVWQIATQPTPEAHFATYPEALVERCIKAGTSERGECADCGAPWQRVVERESAPEPMPYNGKHGNSGNPQSAAARIDANKRARRAQGFPHDQSMPAPRAVGWAASCECAAPEQCACVEPGGCVGTCDWARSGQYRQSLREQIVAQTVLDPFVGSGTTALVARRHGRKCIGIDLSAEYLAIAAKRTQQLSLLGEGAA